MNLGKTLFAQLTEFVPWTAFARIVARHSGDARITVLTSTEDFRMIAYAQLIWRESLRDIEAALGANATYVLIAIIKKELHLNASLYFCPQILSVSVLRKP